jgi:Fe-S cluster assembly protein SufD
MELSKTVETAENLISAFEELSLKLDGMLPEYVKERRKEAASSFRNLGFPTKKQEEYKYTDFSPALKKDYRIGNSSNLSESDLKPFYYQNLEANVIIIINGTYSPSLSKIEETSLEISDFAESKADILEKYFGKETYTAKDPFAELNTAFSTGGVTIRVPKGKAITKPVAIHYFSDCREVNTFSQPRTLILAEAASLVTVIESFHTIGENESFTNILTDLVLHQDAIVDYYKIENDSPASYHVGSTVVTQEGKSTFNSATITLNGAIVRNNMNVVLAAPYSEATFYGLYFPKGRQLVDNHTMVDHAVPNCESNELYKGILDERAIGVFNGKIFVKQDAQKTNAFQSNRNILLSRDAIMNTKPQLEIFADDVKCSHGATVGQLEDESLFYLRSRGMSKESAISLLLQAFAKDVIDHIKVEPLREFLNQAIETRLD